MIRRGERGAAASGTSAASAPAGSYFFFRPVLGFVVSETVVFGCRFAVPFVTYRPVIAERFLLGIAFTSFPGQATPTG